MSGWEPRRPSPGHSPIASTRCSRRYQTGSIRALTRVPRHPPDRRRIPLGAGAELLVDPPEAGETGTARDGAGRRGRSGTRPGTNRDGRGRMLRSHSPYVTQQSRRSRAGVPSSDGQRSADTGSQRTIAAACRPARPSTYSGCTVNERPSRPAVAGVCAEHGNPGAVAAPSDGGASRNHTTAERGPDGVRPRHRHHSRAGLSRRGPGVLECSDQRE